MLLLLDNYDSFTYNLYHYLGELGAEVLVRRNDALTVAEAMQLRPRAIVISPGGIWHPSEQSRKASRSSPGGCRGVSHRPSGPHVSTGQ